jgi:hypothetical protein
VISESLGPQDFGGFALWGGHVDLKTRIAGRQGQLYPIGIKGIYVVVDEENPRLVVRVR